MKTSQDTVLRTLRQNEMPEYDSPHVLGIDDWAIRKGSSYGTIIVDLENHKIIDLLPERSAEAVAEWLKAHPTIEIVTRDRSNVYAHGISQGAPQAEQVADRFHLLQNLTEVTKKVIKKHTSDIHKALFPTEEIENLPLPPIRVTEADKRRQKRVREAHNLSELGWYAKDIAKQMGLSRGFGSKGTKTYAKSRVERCYLSC